MAWMRAQSEYRILWAELPGMNPADALERHREIEKNHREMDKATVPEFPIDETLLAKCHEAEAGAHASGTEVPTTLAAEGS